MSNQKDLTDSSGSEHEEDYSLENPNVISKYLTAAEITNRVLGEVIERCVTGASVRDTCIFGDRRIEESIANVYKKNKNIKKGICGPTCLSLNNQVAFYSPMLCDADAFLSQGDLVKVELGCHIDGFPAMAAHTLVVGAEKVVGRKADVIHAGYAAFQAAIRLIKPGADNRSIASDLKTIARSFDCEMIEDWGTYSMERYNVEGNKFILNVPSSKKSDTQEKFVVEPLDIYGIDIVVSTGTGKCKPADLRTTVHRKLNAVYPLKMKSARSFLHEVDKRFGNMPFSLRSLSNETQARLGVSECVNHSIMEVYPVICEKEGEYVARFKTTLLITSTGARPLTGILTDPLKQYHTEHVLSDERLKTLLMRSLPSASSSAKKKRKRLLQEGKADTVNRQDAAAVV